MVVDSAFNRHLSPVGWKMAIGGSVSGYLWSWFDDSVNDFNCRLPGVDKESKTKITPFKVQKVQLNI